MILLAMGFFAGVRAWAAAPELPDLVASASPSVVAVGTYDELKNPRFTFRGTGFVVGDGLRVATNAHVLPKVGDSDVQSQVAVLVPRAGATPEVRLVMRKSMDAAHDLAVLNIDGAALPPLALGDAKAARAGTAVVLVGFPLGTGLGFVPAAHRGIVAAVTAVALPAPAAAQLDARTVNRLRQGAFDILQLDAIAYPGNSGSPLLDTGNAKVVGIVNMVFIKSTKESAIGQPTGITYAIPVRYLQELLDQR